MVKTSLLKKARDWASQEYRHRSASDRRPPQVIVEEILAEADVLFRLGSYGVVVLPISMYSDQVYLDYGNAYAPTIVVETQERPSRGANFQLAIDGWAEYAGARRYADLMQKKRSR